MSKSSTKQVHAKLLEMEAIGKKYAVRACAYRVPCAVRQGVQDRTGPAR